VNTNRENDKAQLHNYTMLG